MQRILIFLVILVGSVSCRPRGSNLFDVSDKMGWRLGLNLAVDPERGIYDGYVLVLCKNKVGGGNGRIYSIEEFQKQCATPFSRYDQESQKWEAVLFAKIPENLQKEAIQAKVTGDLNKLGDEIDGLTKLLLINHSAYADIRSKLGVLKLKRDELDKPIDPVKPKPAPPVRRIQNPDGTTTLENIPQKTLAEQKRELDQQIESAAILMKKTNDDIEKDTAEKKKKEGERSGITYETVSLNSFNTSERELADSFPQIFSGGWQAEAKAQVESIPLLIQAIKNIYNYSYSCVFIERFPDLARELLAACVPESKVEVPLPQDLRGNNAVLNPGAYYNRESNFGHLEIKGNRLTFRSENATSDQKIEFVCAGDGSGVCQPVDPNGYVLLIDTTETFYLVNIDGYRFYFRRLIPLNSGMYSFYDVDKTGKEMKTSAKPSALIEVVENGARKIAMQGTNTQEANYDMRYNCTFNTCTMIDGPSRLELLTSNKVQYFRTPEGSQILQYFAPLLPTFKEGQYIEFDDRGDIKHANYKLTRKIFYPFTFELVYTNDPKSFTRTFECDGENCISKDGKFIAAFERQEREATRLILQSSKRYRLRYVGP